MSEPLKAPSLKRLEKEIAVAEPYGISALGLNIVQKSDVVLQYLAMSDEREWSRMIRTDPAINGAIEQRITGLMDAGSAVIEGPSHSEDAARYKDFTVRMLKRIPRFETLRREALMAIYYGWRPIELQWTSELEFEGRSYWGIDRAVARKPWHYHFTADGYLALTVGADTVVYNGPSDNLRFMIARAGSTECPYGESVLSKIWTLYFLSAQFTKMSGQAMQRSLGILKVTRNSTGSALNVASVSDATISSEVRGFIDKLNSNNVLVESQGYSLNVLPEPTLANNITTIMDYFNTQKRIAIVGQNLTSEVKGGSFAAEQGHGEILDAFINADAREEADWWNDGLIKPVLEMNFGAIDEMDMPRWMPKVLTRPNLAATQTYFDMGGEIDGRLLANEMNVPAWFDAGEGDVILRKQASPLFSLLPGGPDQMDKADPKQAIGVVGKPAEKPAPGVKPDMQPGKQPPPAPPAADSANPDGLNGAQIQAALEVVSKVVTDQLPGDAGIELLIAVGLKPEAAQKMIASAVKFNPAPPPTPQPIQPRAMRDLADAAAELATKKVDKASAEASDGLDAEMERYYSSLLGAFKESNPDPKA